MCVVGRYARHNRPGGEGCQEGAKYEKHRYADEEPRPKVEGIIVPRNKVLPHGFGWLRRTE